MVDFSDTGGKLELVIKYSLGIAVVPAERVHDSYVQFQMTGSTSRSPNLTVTTSGTWNKIDLSRTKFPCCIVTYTQSHHSCNFAD